MSIDLGRRLIAAGLVSPEEVEAALFVAVARGVPFTRVLIDRGAVSERVLEEELERVGGLGLRQVAGSAELYARLPRAMCRRLAALPTRVDPETGAIDVAAADPLDPHLAAEIGFHLAAPVRVLRAPIAAVEEAIRRLELDESDIVERARHRRVTPPFPHGAPQSSIPPPVLDEAPIPLVRKAHGAGPGNNDGTTQRAGGTLVPPTGAPPLARLAVPAHRPLGAIAPSPQGARERRPQNNHATPEAPGVAAGGRAGAEPPAVSFPSRPPAANGDRITPPYGTPVYDPLAVGRSLSSAAGHDGGYRPQTPGVGYRIAPPAEDPYARARGPVEEAQPPAVPLSPVPPAPAPRRPARPVLGDVPYPAAIPAQPAQPAGSHRSALPDEDDDPPLAIPPLPPRRVRAPEGGPVMEALRQTTSRDEVIRVAMRGMRLVARRLAVFAVKRDGFYGWACNVELGDSEALRALRVPADQPSVLATATATAVYLGPIPSTPAHEGLLRVMERASADVAAVAVRVAGRPALVLLCDELDDTMTGTRFLVEMARAAGEALARLIAPRG